VLNYYESHGIHKQRIRLVINRFSKDVGLSKEMAETALQSEIFHVMSSDYESVQRALLEGKAIAPSSLLGKEIAQLASQLVGKVDRPQPAKEKSRSNGAFGGLFSMFSRS
jgi:pilus assembly protein CpaE